VTASADAYSALWQHFIEMDLIGEVRANLRPIDEPVRWQLDDFRAMAKKAERDHLWIRILDVPTALSARHYESPANIVLEVSDQLEHTTGRYQLTVSTDGNAEVAVLGGDIPPDTDAVALTVNELSAVYLGGISAVALARAGRIKELTPGAAAVVERCFRSTTTPWLSISF